MRDPQLRLLVERRGQEGPLKREPNRGVPGAGSTESKTGTEKVEDRVTALLVVAASLVERVGNQWILHLSTLRRRTVVTISSTDIALHGPRQAVEVVGAVDSGMDGETRISTMAVDNNGNGNMGTIATTMITTLATITKKNIDSTVVVTTTCPTMRMVATPVVKISNVVPRISSHLTLLEGNRAATTTVEWNAIDERVVTVTGEVLADEGRATIVGVELRDDEEEVWALAVSRVALVQNILAENQGTSPARSQRLLHLVLSVKEISQRFHSKVLRPPTLKNPSAL
jgi:hypothetical protein